MAAQRTEKEETEFKPETPLAPLSLSTPSITVPLPPRKFRSAVSPSRPQIKTLPETVDVTEVPVVEKREVRRCAGCRKKVGLTGFRCRCGDLFCSEHRYSDRHVCGYDYKAAGREAIAKENPLVKAAKIIRL